jgi:hypothetical protein
VGSCNRPDFIVLGPFPFRISYIDQAEEVERAEKANNTCLIRLLVHGGDAPGLVVVPNLVTLSPFRAINRKQGTYIGLRFTAMTWDW